MDYIDRKHLLTTSLYLEGFKDLGSDKFNCRCPFCGDSQKNSRKRRGYFFVHDNTTFYKCHNCGTSLNFSQFLQEFSPDLASQYRFDKFSSKYKKKEVKQDVGIEKFLTNTSEKLKKSQNILNKATRMLTLDDTHKARKYLDNRKIPKRQQKNLFYVDNAQSFVKNIPGYEKSYTPKGDAILIPFFNEVGVLTYFQLRFFEGNIRYLTFEISPGKKMWGLSDIDWTKPVYVTEGPFDAMFIDNGLAVAGVSILSETKYLREKCENGYILVFDKDYQENREVYEQLLKAIEQNEKIVFFDKHFSGKDVNEAVINNGWTTEDLMDYLKNHTKSGLAAKLALSNFKKPPRKIKYA